MIPYSKIKFKKNGFRLLRIKTRKTQQELSKLTGISARTLSAWEHWLQVPQAKTLLQYHTVLRAHGLTDITFSEMMELLEQYKSAWPYLPRRSYGQKLPKKF